MKQKLFFIMFALFATHVMGYAQGASTTAQTETREESIERYPEFPGGMGEMMKYLSENIKYPKICQDQGVQGRVIIQFVVDTDGSITDIQVVNPINPYLDMEAVRVVNSMPKWIPGMREGKNVRVRYTLPIEFNLSK